MFVGTVRHNLDPFGEYPDDELWRALEIVGVSEKIKSLEVLRMAGEEIWIGVKRS